MEFAELVKKRRSVRAYQSRPIDRKILEKIGEAVRLSPSACNIQPWVFKVITNAGLKEKICRVYTRDWLAQAPIIVAAVGNRETAWKRPEGNSIIDIDIGIAMEHFILSAANEGLGTCWICAYDVKKMNEALEISPPWSVMAVSPLGFPADNSPQPEKKQLENIWEII
jgi:nitroreductase